MEFKVIWQTGLLLGIGCLQMAGDLLGMSDVKAIGLITHASPAPKVFTTQNGYETYSPRFFVTAFDDSNDGQGTTLQLTPAVNAKLLGPYNRRNAYGAALSYGPVLASNDLTSGMFDSVLHYALCRRGGLTAEVGLPEAQRYQVRIEARSSQLDSDTTPNSKFAAPANKWPNTFSVSCNKQNGDNS